MSISRLVSQLLNWLRNENSNSHDQYSFYWDNGVYNFKTELGLTYSVYFFETGKDIYCDYPKWCNNIYEIGFDVKGFKTTYDNKVETTIIAIISEVFNSKNNILLFVCETLDHLELARFKLFNRWYYKHNTNKQLLKLDFKGLHGNNVIYTSLIYHSENDYAAEIKEAFSTVCEQWYYNP